MKNRTREICTSGSVRDEEGQPPHLLGRHQFLHLAGCAAVLPAVSRIAMTQTYPARPITMVVPYAPGGATDVMKKLHGDIAERYAKRAGGYTRIVRLGRVG